VSQFTISVEDTSGAYWEIRNRTAKSAESFALGFCLTGAVSEQPDGGFVVIPAHKIKLVRITPAP